MVLACPMSWNEADASTVREYLVALAQGVWSDGEGFSGKRPFGTSGWQSEPITALVEAGLCSTEREADKLIQTALTAMRGGL